MANVTIYKSNPSEDIFSVNVSGTIISATVTANPNLAKRWLSSALHAAFYHVYVRNDLVVGLGVQSTPAPEGSGTPPADTLVLCIGKRCLIFRLSRALWVPKKLRDLLLNPSHTFFGIWNSSDREKLRKSMHALEMHKDPVDLRLKLTDHPAGNLAEATVDEIIRTCTGFEVEQNRTLRESNWNEDHLSLEQIGYASVDAYCAFVIAIGNHNMAA